MRRIKIIIVSEFAKFSHDTNSFFIDYETSDILVHNLARTENNLSFFQIVQSNFESALCVFFVVTFLRQSAILF